MNRKESEIYESFPKDKWVYDFNEYRLHHSFSEEFIKKAKEMNLVIGDMQGYRLDKLGSWSDELEFNANVDDLLDDFQTWNEQVEKSYNFFDKVIKNSLRKTVSIDDELYITFTFDKRPSLSLVNK
jgi:hypothetical protein